MQKWVALALLLLLLTAGCQRRGGAAGAPPASGSPGSAEAGAPSAAERSRDRAGGTPPAPPARGAPEPRAPAAGEVVPSREITLQRAAEARPGAVVGERARLLPLPSPPRLPEDFRIGPLADRLAPGGTAERQILSVSSRLLEGLVAGKVTEPAILAEARLDLGRSLQYYIDQGLIPRDFRLGAIYFEQDTTADGSTARSASAAGTAWLNVRLFGTPGVAEGELYLSSSGGEWYVSDLQVGFPLLAEPYERSSEKYMPSVYGWRLQ